MFEEHPAVMFQSNAKHDVSVDIEKFRTKQKHNDDLKEFLTPILNNQQAMKMKNCGKKVKSHSQALGLDLKVNETINQEKRNNEHSEINEKKKELGKKKKVKKIRKYTGLME